MEQNNNNNNNNDYDKKIVGDTLPMYDQVKNEIYKNYKELNNYSALLRTSRTKSEEFSYLIHLRRSYSKLYIDVKDGNMLKKISVIKRKKLSYYFFNINKINRLNCHTIISICRDVISSIGITNIQFITNSNPGAVENGDSPD